MISPTPKRCSVAYEVKNIDEIRIASRFATEQNGNKANNNNVPQPFTRAPIPSSSSQWRRGAVLLIGVKISEDLHAPHASHSNQHLEEEPQEVEEEEVVEDLILEEENKSLNTTFSSLNPYFATLQSYLQPARPKPSRPPPLPPSRGNNQSQNSLSSFSSQSLVVNNRDNVQQGQGYRPLLKTPISTARPLPSVPASRPKPNRPAPPPPTRCLASLHLNEPPSSQPLSADVMNDPQLPPFPQPSNQRFISPSLPILSFESNSGTQNLLSKPIPSPRTSSDSLDSPLSSCSDSPQLTDAKEKDQEKKKIDIFVRHGFENYKISYTNKISPPKTAFRFIGIVLFNGNTANNNK
eukprot:TRINITY_DN889_c0_g1_i1.p1 TRINITY_DN889_c0_g1~~TRINITY_DN889_c0_g1_i1.p1  ORF type:complete len:351 (+),score=85.72 TRINITY_DN889_c0_g1_i1:79-1131(+)